MPEGVFQVQPFGHWSFTFNAPEPCSLTPQNPSPRLVLPQFHERGTRRHSSEPALERSPALERPHRATEPHEHVLHEILRFRGFAEQRTYAPLCFDATHSAQRPGAGELASAGNRNEVAPLARAAVAAGVDALFIEVHPDPENAPCDGECQIRIADIDRLLGEVSAIQSALGRAHAAQD